MKFRERMRKLPFVVILLLLGVILAILGFIVYKFLPKAPIYDLWLGLGVIVVGLCAAWLAEWIYYDRGFKKAKHRRR